MDSIKVIFLDIDGVLLSTKTTRRTSDTKYLFVEIRCILNLKRIISETGAKVVLSSDWRCDRDNPEYNSDFLELQDELRKYDIEFYGFTPEISSEHRGAEIDLWLSEHPEVSNFVILDDRLDIEPNKDHWVQTMLSRGLCEEETNEAIKILMNAQ